MANYLLMEAVLDALAHMCALTGLAYTARAAHVADGWMRVPVVASLPDAPLLSIIVPARNEERTIERCVRSLLAQTLDDYELIVVDDRSEDRTGEILAALAREDARLRVVHGTALPDGWVGKPWALVQGSRAARGTWLLFTDADTVHVPEGSSSVLAFARRHAADVVSLGPHQELGSFAERAVLPVILGMLLIAYHSMAALNDPADKEHALANGQYLLVSRYAYDALGGHEALHGEITEDAAFARRVKDDGRFRLLVAAGDDIVAVRMYTSLRELWDGFTRTMYVGAQGDLRVLLGGSVALALLSAVPAALTAEALARKRPLRALEAGLCLINGIAVVRRGLTYTRLPRSYAWYAPIGYAVCGAVIVNSTLRVMTGRGVEWRGRRYTGRIDGDRP